MKPIKIISLGFIIGFILLSGLMEQAAKAQPSKVPIGRSFFDAQPKGACRIDPSITFTQEQTKELQNLQRAYLEEAKPLWGEMRDLRLENLLFSYRVKARAIFTKEQFERFPQECPLKMGPGVGMGKSMGKGPQKGIR